MKSKSKHKFESIAAVHAFLLKKSAQHSAVKNPADDQKGTFTIGDILAAEKSVKSDKKAK